MEDQESLQSSAVVSKSADSVEDSVDDFLKYKRQPPVFLIPNLSDGVVSPGVVVSGILLASNHLLRVEQLLVRTSSDLI